MALSLVDLPLAERAAGGLCDLLSVSDGVVSLPLLSLFQGLTLVYVDVAFLVLVQPQELVAFVCLGRILGGILLSTDSPPFSPCSLSRIPVAVLSLSRVRAL